MHSPGTFCSKTRYTGNRQERIISSDVNWLHGHWRRIAGLVFTTNKWLGSSNGPGVLPNNNWVILCTSHDGKNRYLNGVKQNDNVVGDGTNKNIFINDGISGSETSDYGVAFIVSWNRDLTHEELLKVSSVLIDGALDGKYFEMIREQSGTTSEEYLQCALDYCNKHSNLRLKLCSDRYCRTRLDAVACHNHWVNIGSKEIPVRQPDVYDCQQSTVTKTSCATSTKNGESGRLMLDSCINKFFDSGSVGTTIDVNYAGCTKCFDEWTTLHAGSVWAPGGKNRLQTKDINMPVCSKCDAGRYSDSVAHELFLCKACPLGYISSVDRQSCQKCNAGKYMDELGGSICKLCSAGKFAASDKAIGCINCPQGTFSPTVLPEREIRNECKPCAVGTYVDITGAIECKLCSEGTYGVKIRGINLADGCSNCETGQSQSQKGKTECNPCKKGEVQSAEGKTTCDLCEKGQTTKEPKQSTCDFCKTRTYLSEAMRGIDSEYVEMFSS